MERINPLMVTLARESRGLTQTALSSLANIAQGHLSKIETGQVNPPEATLNAIASALNYPPELFFEELEFRNLPVSFYRKQKTTSATITRRVRACANLARLHVVKLLQSAEIPTLRLPRVILQELSHTPESAAQELRLVWHVPPGPIENVTKLVEDAGVVVLRCDFGTPKIDAISIYEPRDEIPPVVLISASAPGDRLRFSLIHEIAHIVLHHHTEITGDEAEHEANRLAAEFLMPRSELRGQFAKLNIQKLAHLKPRWKVSMQALLQRAWDLGKITERQRRHLWMQINQLGYRVKEPFQVPREEPSLVRELVQFHLGDLGYSESELSAALRLRPDEFRTAFGVTGASLRIVKPHSGA